MIFVNILLFIFYYQNFDTFNLGKLCVTSPTSLGFSKLTEKTMSILEAQDISEKLVDSAFSVISPGAKLSLKSPLVTSSSTQNQQVIYISFTYILLKLAASTLINSWYVIGFFLILKGNCCSEVSG